MGVEEGGFYQMSGFYTGGGCCIIRENVQHSNLKHWGLNLTLLYFHDHATGRQIRTFHLLLRENPFSKQNFCTTLFVIYFSTLIPYLFM